MGTDWLSVTRREAEILEALRERLTNAEIGARFFISERTVESHVSSLLRKLRVRDRVDLAALVPPAAAPELGNEPLPGTAEVLAAGPLVGRREELERATALWKRAAMGQTRLCLVTGEAGVGKSRLVAELAAAAHREGATVLWGACPEDVQAPYQPFFDALEHHAALFTSGPLDQELGESAAVLARMFGLHSTTGPERVRQGLDPGTGASEVWLALRRYVSWLASKAPVLLVIEDLHWAAESTRQALLQIVRSAGAIPLLVLATSRDTRPDVDDAGEVFLGKCDLLPNSDRIALDGLDPQVLAELLAVLGSGADAGHVHAETGGNPLLARELVRSAGSRGSSLAALLMPRYLRLGPEATAVVNAAAVLGATFDATEVGRVLDRPVMDVVQALDEAAAAGLVVSIPDRPGRFAFVHPLFRTLHYQRLTTSTRLELHHRAAVELEQGAGDDRKLAALARHACIAASVGDPRAAIGYACDAAAAAERVLALDEAAQHYEQALEVAELLPNDPRLRLQLTTRLGEVLAGSGGPVGREMLLQAASAASALGDGAALADIAWGMVRFGTTTTPGATDREFMTIAERALTMLDGQVIAARARLLAALSTQLAAGGDPERGLRCIEESLAIARALGDPGTLGVALLSQRHSGGLPLRPEARLEIAGELLGLGQRLGEPILTLNGRYTEAWSFRELGDLDRHDRSVAEFESQLRDHPVPYLQMTLAIVQAVQTFLQGDLDAVEERLPVAYELAEAAAVDPVALCGPMHFLVMLARGRAGELVPVIEEQVERQPGFRGTYEALLAVTYAHAGRLEDAQRIIEAAASDGFASVRPNVAYTSGLALFAEAAALTGAASAAKKVIHLLEPYAGLIADNGASITEPIDLAIARAALASGDPARARASAEAVLASSVGKRAPVFRGRALILLAAAGKTPGAPADSLVREACLLARRTGAFVIERDAERYGLALSDSPS